MIKILIQNLRYQTTLKKWKKLIKRTVGAKKG